MLDLEYSSSSLVSAGSCHVSKAALMCEIVSLSYSATIYLLVHGFLFDDKGLKLSLIHTTSLDLVDARHRAVAPLLMRCSAAVYSPSFSDRRIREMRCCRVMHILKGSVDI